MYDLLNRIKDICELIKGGEMILNLKYTTPKYQELGDLVQEIVYYFIIVKFVGYIQDGEDFTIELMESFLKYFKKWKNYEACCYLYEGLSKPKNV